MPNNFYAALDAGRPILAGLFFIAALVGIFWWFDVRCMVLLREWAEENGFQIAYCKQRYLFTGPFRWWTNSRWQSVYFVRVRDREDHERSGWVRCGSYFGGIFFSKRVEVRWEDL